MSNLVEKVTKFADETRSSFTSINDFMKYINKKVSYIGLNFRQFRNIDVTASIRNPVKIWVGHFSQNYKFAFNFFKLHEGTSVAFSTVMIGFASFTG